MSGKVRFSEEQYRYARDEANALDYAMAHGYALVKSGNCYYMRDHDSMVFMPDGRWFWNSRGKRGRAIEFLMCYEQMTLPEAVLALCDHTGLAHTQKPAELAMRHRQSDRKPFVLPPAADGCKRLFGYLCTTRGLDREIVVDLMKNESLYESAVPYRKASGETGVAHNAVFVGRDAKGTPKSAFQRGLSSYDGRAFKMDVAGSDASTAFCVPGRAGVDTVVVFEAAIDAISHATIYKLAGLDYQNCDRIAQGGTEKTNALLNYLKANPAIKYIYLAYDEDDGGEAATNRAKELLSSSGDYSIRRIHSAAGKDWNDYLLLWRSTIRQDKTVKEPGSVGQIRYLSDDGSADRTDFPTSVEDYKETVSALFNQGRKFVATLYNTTGARNI